VKELLLIFFCFIGVYLLVSLATYNPLDPGWSHSGQTEEVQNKGGIAGALFADIFFYLFGYLAYLFPLGGCYVGWLVYQGKHRDLLDEPHKMMVQGIGFVLTLIAGCGLAIVHFADESILLPSHAGGLLGVVVGKNLQYVFSQLGATLLLLALFFTGITFLTGLSWLKLMDRLGYHTLEWTPRVRDFVRYRIFPLLIFGSKQSWRATTKAANFTANRSKSMWTSWQQWRARRRDQQQRAYEEEYEEYYDDEPIDNTDNVLQQPAADVAKPVVTPAPVTASRPVQTETEIPTQETVAKPVVEELAHVLPALSLLDPAPKKVAAPRVEMLIQWLTKGFREQDITIKVKEVHSGPVLTGFEIESPTELPRPLDELGAKLATALRVERVRIIETAQDSFGIEVANATPEKISLSDLLASEEYHSHPSAIPLALGKDIGGYPLLVDLTRAPHILMAGNDATEKNSLLHSILLSLVYKLPPNALRLIMADDKTHTFSMYAELPHLLYPLISDITQLPNALKWCVQEMERRYRLMASHGVRNIEGYNHALQQSELTVAKPLPYLVIIISELSELTLTSAGLDAEEPISLLTQKARAAGIHLILATQFPSVNVITGLIKSNIPTRIALKVSNKSESRAILAQLGAEILLGHGDLFYLTTGTGIPMRAHGCMASLREVDAVVENLKSRAKPQYHVDI
jgi:S-DNA-T family DNA segregation ATPase FtsK/SpoIIIE